MAQFGILIMNTCLFYPWLAFPHGAAKQRIIRNHSHVAFTLRVKDSIEATFKMVNGAYPSFVERHLSVLRWLEEIGWFCAQCLRNEL